MQAIAYHDPHGLTGSAPFSCDASNSRLSIHREHEGLSCVTLESPEQTSAQICTPGPDIQHDSPLPRRIPQVPDITDDGTLTSKPATHAGEVLQVPSQTDGIMFAFRSIEPLGCRASLRHQHRRHGRFSKNWIVDTWDPAA